LADRTLEAVGEVDHVALALFARLLLRFDLGCLETLDLEAVGLEYLDGLRHLADFVAAVLLGHLDLEVIAGETFHGNLEPGDRLRHRLQADEQRDRDAEDQSAGADAHHRPGRGFGIAIDRFLALDDRLADFGVERRDAYEGCVDQWITLLVRALGSPGIFLRT